MKKKVINTIKKYGLISEGDRVLLALSGGSDSVCLLHILNEIKDIFHFELFAAHLNHSIRAEADSDEIFVKELCRNLGIECYLKKTDIKKAAAEEKISEELAGRNERYAFFDEICRRHNINLIATAHNKNDTAETVFMHIIRGSGLDGMGGIAYRRGNIIRPLLDASKKEIEEFCFRNGYVFVKDKTNDKMIYTRNKIRLGLLPFIEKEFNPNIVDVIVKNAALLKEDSDFINSEAQRAFAEIADGNRISVEKFNLLPVAIKRRIILLMYRQYSGEEKNPESVHVENILELIKNAHSGKKCDIPGNAEFVIEQDYAFFRSNVRNKDYDYRLILDKDVYIEPIKAYVRLKKWENEKEKFFLDDADDVHVRNRRQGDVFYPSGMTGRKKLSDYFTDCKIPLSEREVFPILTFGNDIVWIPGKRYDRRFRQGKTAYTLIFKEE